MMTKTNISLLPRLLMWSLLLGCCLPSLYSQTLDTRLGSNCVLHVRLLDSTGSVTSTQAPYLLKVNNQQRNSNTTASWQIDLSNETDVTYDITVIDNNLTRYNNSITSTCSAVPPASAIQLGLPTSTPTNNCNLCTGSAGITLASSTNGFHTFAWSNGTTTVDTFSSSISGLCAGTYSVVVSDSFGNQNSAVFEILCGAPTGITCFPTITRTLDANGQASISVQDVRTASTFNSTDEYFIDAQDNFSPTYTFDCSDIGYQYLTVLSKDSLTARYDTCQVLVKVVDNLNYCGAYSNTSQVSDTSTDATNCAFCNGSYVFNYLIQPVSGDTIFPVDLNFYWADTLATNNVRFNLCPNTPYELTVVDNANNRYEYTITVGCPSNNCVAPSSILTNSYCPDVFIPVCGCDNITYKNACVAEYEAGIQTWTQGSCSLGNFQLNITSFPDSSSCDTSIFVGSGAAFTQIIGGSGVFSYTWSNGVTTSFINNVTAGTYFLTVTDATTNFFINRVVIVGSQGCVWPGDADDNGVANNFDLLSIGLVHGSNGPSRATSSINWQGFPSQNWPATSIPGLANSRHIDCNGDGFIDSSDVQAILVNYGQSYARSGGNSLLGTIPFYVESGVGEAGDSITTNIMLGDSINPAVDVYAVAFTINYNPNHLERDPVQIDFNNSWLGNDLLHIQKDVRTNGQIEIAVTRKDQQPITGSGPIGAVSFTIKDDLVMGRLAGDSIVSPLGISNVRLINERNQIIGTYPKTGNLVLEENLSTPKRPNAAGILIFPNPAQEVLHIRSKTAGLERVQIFTATGQLVQSIELNSLQEYQLNTQAFTQGLYILQLQTSSGNFSEKIRVLH